MTHEHVLVYPLYFLFFFQHILQGTAYPWCLSHDEKLMCKYRICGFPLQITVTTLMYFETTLIGLKKAVSHFLRDSFSNRFYMFTLFFQLCCRTVWCSQAVVSRNLYLFERIQFSELLNLLWVSCGHTLHPSSNTTLLHCDLLWRSVCCCVSMLIGHRGAASHSSSFSLPSIITAQSQLVFLDKTNIIEYFVALLSYLD